MMRGWNYGVTLLGTMVGGWWMVDGEGGVKMPQVKPLLHLALLKGSLPSNRWFVWIKLTSTNGYQVEVGPGFAL